MACRIYRQPTVVGLENGPGAEGGLVAGLQAKARDGLAWKPSLDTATSGRHCWWPLAMTSAASCRHHEMNAKWFLSVSISGSTFEVLASIIQVSGQKPIYAFAGIGGRDAPHGGQRPSPPNRKTAAKE